MPLPPSVSRPVLAAAFLLGAAHWTVLVGGGAESFDTLDWTEQHGRLEAIRVGIAARAIPWSIDVRAPRPVPIASTPDVIWSPPVVLLPWISDGAFALSHILLCYAAGFAGLVRLAAARGWGTPGFLFFFLVFEAGGHAVSHLAVGHLMWAAFLLLPWFLECAAGWAEGRDDAGLAVRTAAVVGVISLSGAFHIAHWCLIAVGCLALVRWKSWPAAALAAILVAGATAVRWLPAVYAIRRSRWEWANGFPDVPTFLAAFVSLRTPTSPRDLDMGWWEFDHFTGWSGTLAFLVLGLVPLVRRAVRDRDRTALAYLSCVVLMTALSVDRVFTWTLTSVPGLGAERVATRLVVVPWLLLAMLAADRAGDAAAWCWVRLPSVPVAALALALLAGELGRHAVAWRVSRVREGFPPIAAPIPFRVLTADDPLQRVPLTAGALVSAAFWAVLLPLALRRRPGPPPG